MTKQTNFIILVQTSVIANAINLSSVNKWADEYRHVISQSGTRFIMSEAIWASKRIPDQLDATDAADEFCQFMFENVKNEFEEAHGKKLQRPNWFMRV